MRLLTMSQTASILQVSEGRAYELARTGLLPVVRLGRQIRVSEESLNKFIGSGGKALGGGWRKNP